MTIIDRTWPNRNFAPRYENEPSLSTTDAMRAVLLFHDGGPWLPAREFEWARITGTREATTKVLCDHMRYILAGKTDPEPGECHYCQTGHMCERDANGNPTVHFICGKDIPCLKASP